MNYTFEYGKDTEFPEIEFNTSKQQVFEENYKLFIKNDGKPRSLKRSSNCVINEIEYDKCIKTPGTYCLTNGSGPYTTTYFYHTLDGNKIFIHINMTKDVKIYNCQFIDNIRLIKI